MEFDHSTEISFLDIGVGLEIRNDKREAYLREWKRVLLDVRKDNPSKSRKFLRWRFTESCTHQRRRVPIVTMSAEDAGELEVVTKTPLAP